MAVSLTKGQKVNLSKAVEKLANVTVGLGWDMAQNGNSIDCDSSVFVLRESTKQISKKIASGLFGLFSKNKKQKKLQKCGLTRSDDIVYMETLHMTVVALSTEATTLLVEQVKGMMMNRLQLIMKKMPEDIKS